jgi:hypothetical protein
MCTVPTLGKAQNASHFYSDVIAVVENLERVFSGKQLGVTAPPALLAARPTKKQKLLDGLNRRVFFDASVQGCGVDVSTHLSGSVITVGGSIEPDYDVDASVSDNLGDKVPLSV